MFDIRMMDNVWYGWGFYLAGVLGMLLFWWRFTRNLPSIRLRRMVRAAMFGLLVCPFSVGDGYSQMAPAFIMVALETLFEGGEAFLRAGPTLLGIIGFMVVLALIWDTFLLIAFGRPAPKNDQPSAVRSQVVNEPYDDFDDDEDLDWSRPRR